MQSKKLIKDHSPVPTIKQFRVEPPLIWTEEELATVKEKIEKNGINKMTVPQGFRRENI